MRAPLAPVACVPSCQSADGHSMEVFAEDQACYSPAWSVDLSREEVEQSGDQTITPFVEVCTRRSPGHEPSVHLHASLIHSDIGFDLTEPEVMRLISSLTAVAALVRIDAEAIR